MSKHDIDLDLLASIKDGDHVVAEYEWDGAKVTVDGPVRGALLGTSNLYHGGGVLRRSDSSPGSNLTRIVSYTPKRDEPGDPIGSVVYVTGDTARLEHGFPAGTEVTVECSDYDLDGDYLCKDAAGVSYWVHSADLDVEPPAVTVANLDACGTWAVVTDRDGAPLVKRDDGSWDGVTAEWLTEQYSPLTIRHRGVQA